MSIINNENFCPKCIKRGGTCMWEDKLYKLNGSKKSPIFLDITVNGCGAFLLDEDAGEDNEKEEDDEDTEDED